MNVTEVWFCIVVSVFRKHKMDKHLSHAHWALYIYLQMYLQFKQG